MAVYVGQSSLDSVVIHRQPFVIESQKMQDGGMKVVDCGDIFNGLVTKLVSSAIAKSFTDSCESFV